MEEPRQTQISAALASLRPRTLHVSGKLASLAESSMTGTITKQLMPYETVAKAIFVKANGLPAYYKATGTVGFTYARQPQAERRRHTDI